MSETDNKGPSINAEGLPLPSEFSAIQTPKSEIKPDNRPERKTYFLITMKRGYTLKNLFVLPLLYTSQIMFGAYLNTYCIYLLRRPDYFDIDSSEIGTVASNVLFWQVLAQMIASIFIGYVFDLLGRKITIGISFVLFVIALTWMPFTAPSLPLLIFTRILVGIALSIQLGNPLIIDYVIMESRGKATVFQNAGFVLGQLLGMGLLFQFTKDLDPKVAFPISAGVAALFGVIATLMITEPKRKEVRDPDAPQSTPRTMTISDRMEIESQIIGSSEDFYRSDELTLGTKIKLISKRVWQVSKSDWAFPVSYFGCYLIRLIQVLFAVYLLLWVTSFVDSGYYETEREAMTEYQQISIIAVVTSVLTVPAVAWASDNAHQGYYISFAFGLRACSIGCFMFLKRPDSVLAYIDMIVLITASGIENVALEAFFVKHVPGDIRGAMTGVFNFFGQLGCLTYSKIGGALYDNRGAQWSFFYVGCLDLFLALCVLILSCLGYLKK